MTTLSGALNKRQTENHRDPECQKKGTGWRVRRRSISDWEIEREYRHLRESSKIIRAGRKLGQSWKEELKIKRSC